MTTHKWEDIRRSSPEKYEKMHKEALVEIANEYGYSVLWSNADEAYIATVVEFPLLASHGETQEQALEILHDEVVEAMEMLLKDGSPVPEIGSCGSNLPILPIERQ